LRGFYVSRAIIWISPFKSAGAAAESNGSTVLIGKCGNRERWLRAWAAGTGIMFICTRQIPGCARNGRSLARRFCLAPANRACDYASDSGVVKTTVTQIHRFSKEDAIVLEGTVD
jgi:hypothetical protein